MNARKFNAATSRDALRMVRNAMGDDAVILSNRKVSGGVEIMAMSNAALYDLAENTSQQQTSAAPPALPQSSSKDSRQQTPQKNSQSSAAASAAIIQAATSTQPSAEKISSQAEVQAVIKEQQGILSEIKSMRSMMQEQLACMAWSDMQLRDPKRSSLLRQLLNAGFSSVLARQLLEKMPPEADITWVSQVLEHNLRIASPEDDVVARGGVYALVGPTGVGKTTTAAKLAARAVVRYGADKVALITTDSYRIGAHEQLRIYGKILGVAVHAVRDTDDLRLTLSALKHKHLVLIDTMGMGQRDSRVAEQAVMFNAAGVQRLLLLNATSGGDTLDDVVRMYHGQGVIGCITTKLDEAVTLGTVLDVVVRHKLNMHYITNGQRVPEDLHEVNLEYLLHRAFKPAAKTAPFSMQDMDMPALMAGIKIPALARGAYAI